MTEGSGRFSMESSGILADSPVTWAARTEQPDSKTRLEQLLAAAYAACSSMALAGHLGRSASAPERLEVEGVPDLQRLRGNVEIRVEATAE